MRRLMDNTYYWLMTHMHPSAFDRWLYRNSRGYREWWGPR